MVREGASPRQKGTLGGAPLASSTDTEPDCTRRMRQEEFPRRKISPRKLSTAKSSSTVPMTGAFGLGDYSVHRVIWNRAAAGDCGEAAAAASAQAMVHLIAMQVGAIAAAAGGDAVGKHRDDFVEIFAIEIAVWKRAAHQREQVVFLPVFGGAGGHDLLRENVQRSFGNFDAIEFAVTDGANQRATFQKFIARGGEKAAFGDRAAPVTLRVRRAAAPRKSSEASRSGRPGLPCRYQCPVPAKQWRRAREFRRL